MEVTGQLHVPAAIPSENDPGTHWIGSWVDPRAGLDMVVETKIPSLTLPETEPWSSCP